MRRWLSLMVTGVLLVAAACASGVEGPQTYAVEVDAPSPEGEKLQVSAFFPGELTAAAGDSIEFSNKSTEAPHTITFGVLADRSNQPQLLTPEGENAAAFAPCRNAGDPTPQITKCESQELGAYDGTGYWNSGLLSPAPAPADEGPKDVTVELADDIPAGQYTFVCVLHPFMNGAITVVEDEADREAPEDVATEAAAARDDALESGQAIEEPDLETEGETQIVSAGWGDRVSSLNRFAPAQIDVSVGTKVRWVPRSPYEPHTVTFEPADDTNPFAPSGVRSGSSYTGGLANSGLIGAEGTPFAGTFELTFAEAGEYKYGCLLHPGQEGTVKVT